MPGQPPLSGRQKRHLRALAQRLAPMVWVREAGLAEGTVRALGEALAAHELVKVRMRAPEDKRAFAAALAEAAGAELAGLVGHTAILFRANPGDPKIELPRRDPASDD